MVRIWTNNPETWVPFQAVPRLPNLRYILRFLPQTWAISFQLAYIKTILQLNAFKIQPGKINTDIEFLVP